MKLDHRVLWLFRLLGQGAQANMTIRTCVAEGDGVATGRSCLLDLCRLLQAGVAVELVADAAQRVLSIREEKCW